MSSRLFQKLREERGLCYSVQTDLTLLEDTGLFSIYAGVDGGGLVESLQVAVAELRRISRRAPSRRELKEAVDYSVGMLRLGHESTTQQMMWLGESLLAHGRVIDPDEACQRLAAVTPEQVSRVAATLFRPGRARMAVIAPETDVSLLASIVTTGLR